VVCRSIQRFLQRKMTKEQAYKIVKLCLELLTPESKWNKRSAFGEKCNDVSDKYTLGCALELTQLAVMGEAKSRNLIMRRVRRKVLRHFFWRYGLHPITNFNRHPKTTYQNVIFVVQQVKESFCPI
jgi:hypothetical protein